MAPDHTAVRSAALELLIYAGLSAREGSFLGQIAFETKPLSEKQLRWLRLLLDRHRLAALDHPSRASACA